MDYDISYRVEDCVGILCNVKANTPLWERIIEAQLLDPYVQARVEELAHGNSSSSDWYVALDGGIRLRGCLVVPNFKDL